jgi:hypothetical protein
LYSNVIKFGMKILCKEELNDLYRLLLLGELNWLMGFEDAAGIGRKENAFRGKGAACKSSYGRWTYIKLDC